MKIFSFWRTAGVALTAFALLFSACENGTQEIEGTVKATAIPAPKVTATVTGSGVSLKWPLIDDASSYEVYRTEQGKSDEVLVSNSISNSSSTGGFITFSDSFSSSSSATSAKSNTKYTYTVIATPVSHAYAHSKTSVSVTTEWLGGTISVSTSLSSSNRYDNYVLNEARDTIINFSAVITLSNFKRDAAYTVERALVTKGVTGTYAPVTLMELSNDVYSNVNLSDYTPDLLGNLPSFNLYDRSLPPKAGTYQYRLKAVKDGKTQYLDAANMVTINPLNYLNISVNVVKTFDGNDNSYSLTPVRTSSSSTSSTTIFKGLLGDNDKLVVYYTVVGASSNYGYNDKIEFTKAEIESGTATKSFTKAKTPSSTTTSFYITARLEYTVDGVASFQNINIYEQGVASPSTSLNNN